MPTPTLNHRILIQQRVGSLDALGQIAHSWQTVAATWARVRALRGREWFAAGQMQNAADHEVVIRHRSGITAAMRVVWEPAGTELAITSEPIPFDGHQDYLMFMAASGVRDG